MKSSEWDPVSCKKGLRDLQEKRKKKGKFQNSEMPCTTEEDWAFSCPAQSTKQPNVLQEYNWLLTSFRSSCFHSSETFQAELDWLSG